MHELRTLHALIVCPARGLSPDPAILGPSIKFVGVPDMANQSSLWNPIETGFRPEVRRPGTAGVLIEPASGC